MNEPFGTPGPIPYGRARGQGMVEYIVVLALIGVAAIGVYSAFGKTTRLQAAAISTEVAGKDATTIITTNAKDAANAAGGRANDPLKEGMARYNYANDQSK